MLQIFILNGIICYNGGCKNYIMIFLKNLKSYIWNCLDYKLVQKFRSKLVILAVSINLLIEQLF